MAYVLEDSVHTSLSANVAVGASSIDVNKSSSPFNDVPDPGGGVASLTLTDSTVSPSKIEIITYTSRTDNGDGTYTLGGVTKNAHGSHGDQSWSSGDVALQGPLVTPDQWGGKTIDDLVQYEDNGAGNPHVKLPGVSQQNGNNIIDVSNLAANGGTVIEWSDGTQDKFASRKEDGQQSSPLIVVPDPLRMAVEAQTGGRMTVLYDDNDFPNYMHVLPRFRYEDLGFSTEMGTGTATAFLVGGTAKSEIFVSAYPADTNVASLPFRDPQINVDYDSAVSQCTGKGTGWHLFTAHEWAAIAMWCMANGFEPRGNTDNGRAHDGTHEVGVRQDGDTYPPGDSNGSARTLTGSGPSAWRHTDDPVGIADLVGTVWEWIHLLKIVDGEFFSPSDNEYDLAEGSWPTLSRFVSNSNTDPELRDSIDSSGTSDGVTWSNLSTTPNTGTYTTSELMKRLLIEPASVLPQGRLVVRDFDERLPYRGGAWGSGSNAGLASLNLSLGRSITSKSIGFRPCYVG